MGLKAVKEHGGLVIAQDPDEAGYGGMPRNAIMTGAVDRVLPVADIPAALLRISWAERSAAGLAAGLAAADRRPASHQDGP